MEHQKATRVVTIFEEFYPSHNHLLSAKEIIERMLQKTITSVELDKLGKTELQQLEEEKKIAVNAALFFERLSDQF